MNTKSYLIRNKERFEVISKYIKRHDTILDLGIGKAGYYRGTNPKRVLGVDNDKIILKRARAIFPALDTIQCQLEEFDTDEKFSLVVMTEIIEHFKDYQFLLDIAKKVSDNYLISVPKSCHIKEHFHPEWVKEDAIKLANKLGQLEDLIEVNTSWIIYANRN